MTAEVAQQDTEQKDEAKEKADREKRAHEEGQMLRASSLFAEQRDEASDKEQSGERTPSAERRYGAAEERASSSHEIISAFRERAAEAQAFDKNLREMSFPELEDAVRIEAQRRAQKDEHVFGKRPFEAAYRETAYLRADEAAVGASKDGVSAAAALRRDEHITDLVSRAEYLRGRMEDPALTWSQKMRLLREAGQLESITDDHREARRREELAKQAAQLGGGEELSLAA